MRSYEVTVATSAPPRVLLVHTDGGHAETVLAGDESLELTSVASFTNARGTIARFRPDAMVLAFGDPVTGEVAELRALRAAYTTPVLVISRPVSEQKVTEFIKAGAGGYLFSEDARRLPEAVRELLRGGVPMSEPVSRLVLGRARRSSTKMAAVLPSGTNGATVLTSRQREILKLLANGHSYDDIGLALNLSVNTVRSHVRSIYERLGASTKVEAVVAAMELRLIDRKPFR
jgi:DNA-binding NarL/FixJ family response regulator